jgi:hypothetical protein
MPPLSAAQVENVVSRLDADGLYHQVDVAHGVLVVLDNIAIRFQIERVEQVSPPFLGKMAFQIGNRAKGAREGGLALAGRRWPV